MKPILCVRLKSVQRPRVQFRKLSAVLFFIALSLAFAELSLRVLAAVSSPVRLACGLPPTPVEGEPADLAAVKKVLPVQQFAPGARWGGFILNSRGFRTPEYRTEKAPGTFRVLTIGDSFTSDSGPVPFPLHWTVLLEKGLTSDHEAVELINLGVPATGPWYHRWILELEGLGLQPDLVIYAFYVGNDFADDVPVDLLIETDEEPPGSYLAGLLRTAWLRVTYAPKAPSLYGGAPSEQTGTYVGDASTYNPEGPYLSEGDALSILVDRHKYYRRSTFPWDRWSANKEEVVQIAALCRLAAIPLVVVLVPAEDQVYRRELVAAADHWEGAEGPLDVRLPQETILELLREQAVPALDLLPVFERAGQTSRLYNTRESHWSAAGNRLTAESVLAFLRQGSPFLNGEGSLALPDAIAPRDPGRADSEEER